MDAKLVAQCFRGLERSLESRACQRYDSWDLGLSDAAKPPLDPPRLAICVLARITVGAAR
jgi:hypothetical protein